MSKIEMQSVSSSNVAAIGYDATNQIVQIEFLNGTLYQYKGVPKHEYERLMHAPSIGSYLHQNYKNVYPYEKIG